MGTAPGLSRKSFIIACALALGVFFLLGGPVWEHPFDIDANVWWSYAAIPPIVLLLLLWERKLGWTALALETIGVTLVKFGTTYVLAALLWLVSGEPPPRPIAPLEGPVSKPTDFHRLPDPASGALLVGTVRDARGAAVPNAWIFIERGIAEVFEPAASVIEWQNGGQGFSPRAQVLGVGQTLVLTSTDGRLHTAQGRPLHGGVPFNRPAMPGQRTEVSFEHPLGLVAVSCRVHPEEPSSMLAVLGHPFSTRTDANGAFALRGVPPGPVGLAAMTSDLRVGRADATGSARIETRVDVRLDSAPAR